MGATSVTGVSGPGDSGGKYKPENQCGGCGCGAVEEEEPKPKVKIGCYVRYGAKGNVSYKVSSGGTSIRVC